jgi:hypothetical protein
MNGNRADSRAVWILLLAVAPACGSERAACPASACGPAATLAIDLPLTFEQLQHSTVTVCHNANCFAGSFASLNAPPSANTGVGIGITSVPDGGMGSGTSGFVRASASGALWLQVYWPSNIDDLADGDKYSVTVEDATGQRVVSFERVAMPYAIVYPNGNDCAPTCRQIVFDEHTP